MDSLRQAYNEWLLVEFPSDSRDDELSSVHDDLLIHDTDVAGCIEHVLGCVRCEKDLCTDNQRLRERLETFEVRCTDSTLLTEVAAYRTYLNGLYRLICQAQAYMRQR